MGRVATAKTGRERGNYHCRLISLFHLALVFQGYANIYSLIGERMSEGRTMTICITKSSHDVMTD